MADPLGQASPEFVRQCEAVKVHAPLVWQQMVENHVELRRVYERQAENRRALLYFVGIVVGCAAGVVVLGLVGALPVG